MSNRVLVVKDFALPKKKGIYYRLLCMTGAQKGESFYLQSDRVVLGRGDEADIKILDSNASREHAEFKKFKEDYIVSDLGSQNGVIVNELKVKQQSLKDSDKIIIGKTVFKYNIIHIEDHAPSLSTNEKETSNATKSTKIKTEPLLKNRKAILILVALALGFLFLIPEDEKKTTAPTKENSQKIDRAEEIQDEIETLIAKKQESEDRELEKKLGEIFLRGLREEREGNYFRAINEFNLALILSPGNGRAIFYKKKTMEKLDQEIKERFDNSSRLKNSLHFKAAIGENCAVVRLLQYTPEDERYKHAQDNVREIEKELGLEENATNCL